jgi:2,3-diaminopropionate biosynthesis protein SbnA
VLYRLASDLVLDDLFLHLDGLVPGIRLILKIEGYNPAGSIKLKTAISLLDEAELAGRLGPGGRIIESSSGNLGIALASLSTIRGYEFTCVVDPNTSRQSIAQMRAFGAKVVEIDTPDANGGFLQSRIDYILARSKADPGLYWPNQYANQANPQAHHGRTAAAVAKEVPDVDVLYVGVGTSGTLVGCARYFRANAPGVRIVAVDAEGSVTFGFPSRRRHIPGLGTSRRPEILEPELADEVVLVSERDTVAMCRHVALRHGITVGGSTGSVLAAVARTRHSLGDGATVVAIGPDLGDRYLDTIYNDAWARDRFGRSLDEDPFPAEPHAARVPARQPPPAPARKD